MWITVRSCERWENQSYTREKEVVYTSQKKGEGSIYSICGCCLIYSQFRANSLLVSLSRIPSWRDLYPKLFSQRTPYSALGSGGKKERERESRATCSRIKTRIRKLDFRTYRGLFLSFIYLRLDNEGKRKFGIDNSLVPEVRLEKKNQSENFEKVGLKMFTRNALH